MTYVLPQHDGKDEKAMAMGLDKYPCRVYSDMGRIYPVGVCCVTEKGWSTYGGRAWRERSRCKGL